MTAYFDANASEPLRDAALHAMIGAARQVGNPSSVHGSGRGARRLLEEARRDTGGAFGIDADNVVFVSGGTEANALAIHAFARAHERRRVLVGATEHDAIRSAAPDAQVLPVKIDGQIDLDSLESALKSDGQVLVRLMAANNETGVLHPLAEIAAICRMYGARLHVDAVQVAGRLPFTLDGISSAAISGHKFGGPKGAGALLLGEGAISNPFCVAVDRSADVAAGRRRFRQFRVWRRR